MSDDLLNQIYKLPAHRKVSNRGDGILICCPFHGGGAERTPSCKISIEGEFKNRYFCFACRDSGHFNTIAEMYGLEGVDDKFSPNNSSGFSFKDMTKKSYDEMPEERTFAWNIKYDWRTIPGKLVKRTGARVTQIKDATTDPRLIFPVKVYGETLGYVTALMNDPKRDSSGKKIELSYVNTKGDWKNGALFCHDLAKLDRFKGRNLWVVEGPRDTLHTLAGNVRAVGMLGSYLSPEQAELIRLLNPPRVMIATDGDDAGEKAAESIYDQLGDSLPISRIKWGKGKDPVDYPRQYIRKIDRRYD